MDFGLKDKAAVVTGGARGIGRAEAEALAEEGCNLAIISRTVQEAENACKELELKGVKALPIKADVTRSQDVQMVMSEVVKVFGRVDVLINNAGITGPPWNKALIDLDEETWNVMIDSHLKSTFLCIKYAAPHMIARRWGRIINTSSIHGRVGGRPSLGHYGAAKAGVIALTRTAARELGPKGITSNVIAPGFIRTAQLEKTLSPDVMDTIEHQIPLGRIGEPRDAARVVAFLASEASSYINGAVIDINGGRWEYFL